MKHVRLEHCKSSCISKNAILRYDGLYFFNSPWRFVHDIFDLFMGILESLILCTSTNKDKWRAQFRFCDFYFLNVQVTNFALSQGICMGAILWTLSAPWSRKWRSGKSSWARCGAPKDRREKERPRAAIRKATIEPKWQKSWNWPLNGWPVLCLF